MKRCYTCKQDLCYEQFGKDRSRRDGYNAHCISCCKSRRDAKKDYYKAYQKDYQQSGKAKERAKAHRETDKYAAYRQTDKYKAYIHNYRKLKRLDPVYRMLTNIRVRQNSVMRGSQSTTQGLGCASVELRAHIESQFTEGMSWDNYGNKKHQWSLDHKLPLSLYYTQPDLLPTLIHYTNLQPLWHIENIKKSNKIVA